MRSDIKFPKKETIKRDLLEKHNINLKFYPNISNAHFIKTEKSPKKDKIGIFGSSFWNSVLNVE